MSWSLHCSKGHRWTRSEAPSPDRTVSLCPTCGQAAIHSTPMPSTLGEPAFESLDQTLQGARPAPLPSSEKALRTDSVAQPAPVAPSNVAAGADVGAGTVEMAGNDPSMGNTLIVTAPKKPAPGGLSGKPAASVQPRNPEPDKTAVLPSNTKPNTGATGLDQTLAPPSVAPESATAWQNTAAIPAAPSRDETLVYEQNTGQSPLSQRPTIPSDPDATERSPRFQPTTPAQPVDLHLPRGKKTGTVPSLSASIPAAVEGYEILNVLGRGGMGIVFKARQVQLDRIVALKMILSGSYASAQDQARFESEARAVAQFKHPNILQIYEVGSSKGQPYFSLEFMEGGTLQEKLEKSPMTAREAAILVETLARALLYAHEKGILHRDIKPANVLLGHDGTPKIADFGLAKRFDRNESINAGDAIVGTPTYMPPEQATGQADIGPTADIYSLGATLYEMLVGRPPFRGATVLDTLQQVKESEPVPLRELQPSVPADLQTICLKCLCKDPRQRYASAGALAADLRNFLDNRPIQARPVPAWEKAWKWSRRNPAAALLIGVTAVSLLGFAIGGLVFAFNERERAETQTQLGKEIAKERDKAISQEKLAIQRGNEALENFKQAQEAVAVLVKLAQSRMTNERQLESIGRELMENALTFYDRFLTQQPSDTRMRFEIARAQWLAGDLREKLGRYKDADRGYARAVELYDTLIQEQPEKADEYRRDLAGVHINRSIVLQVLRDDAGADDAFAKATNLLAKIPPELRDDLVTGWLIGAGCNNRANYLQQRGDPAAAEATYQQSIAVFAGLAKKYPTNPNLSAELAKIKNNLAYLWTTANPIPYDKADALYQEAFDIIKPIVDSHREVPAYQKQLGQVHLNRGILHVKKDQFDQAFGEFQLAKNVFEKLSAAYPGVVDYRHLEALAYLSLGQSRLKRQPPDPSKAIEELKHASNTLKQLATEESKNTAQYRYDFALCLRELARALDIRYRNFYKTPNSKPGDSELRAYGQEVEETWDQTLAQWSELKEPFSGDVRLAADWFLTYKQCLAFHNFEKSRLTKAGSPEVEHPLERRVALTKELLKMKPAEPGLKILVGETLLDLATAQVRLRKPEAAARTVAEIAKAVPPDWEKYWLAARCLVQCIPPIEEILADPEREKAAQSYGERAIVMLRDAAASGWQGAELVRSEKLLEPLRTRPGLRPAYEKLLSELNKK